MFLMLFLWIHLSTKCKTFFSHLIEHLIPLLEVLNTSIIITVAHYLNKTLVFVQVVYTKS